MSARQSNTVGLVALILSIVGFVFACIPGALIVGRVLLPAAFILSTVGLCLSGKSKGTSIAAIIISVIGVINCGGRGLTTKSASDEGTQAIAKPADGESSGLKSIAAPCLSRHNTSRINGPTAGVAGD